MHLLLLNRLCIFACSSPAPLSYIGLQSLLRDHECRKELQPRFQGPHFLLRGEKREDTGNEVDGAWGRGFSDVSVSIALVLLFNALWLVRKTHATLSTNKRRNQAWLARTRLPVTCLLWIQIGSWRCLRPLWFAGVITMVLVSRRSGLAWNSTSGKRLRGAESKWMPWGKMASRSVNTFYAWLTLILESRKA